MRVIWYCKMKKKTHASTHPNPSLEIHDSRKVPRGSSPGEMLRVTKPCQDVFVPPRLATNGIGNCPCRCRCLLASPRKLALANAIYPY